MFPRILALLWLASLLGFPRERGQEEPADAAEISRALLYHPARSIESATDAIMLRAARFTYRFGLSTSQWTVARESNLDPERDKPEPVTQYTVARLARTYRFSGIADEDGGILEIHRTDQAELLARLILWTRPQLAAAWLARWRQDMPNASAEQLARDLEPAEPEVAAVAEDAAHLWLAIRHYAGEGSLGLGTLVRLELETRQVKVFQPRALATSSITHVAVAGDALWLGTYREGEGFIEPTAGLVRFDPASGGLQTYLPGSSPLVGQIVTAMRALNDSLWVATDAGVCRIVLPEHNWTCWRIASMVSVAQAAAVSDRPGGTPARRLPPSSYEVRWANVNFLELITPDPVEGWIRAEELAELKGRGFEMAAYELANTYGDGATPVRLLRAPEGDPLEAAVVYRAALEPVGDVTRDGWQRVRARVGWIPRAGLDVAPRILPP